MIRVVDLFAGPGGLGEGFAAFESRGSLVFDIGLSVEKDATAGQTLRLRKFFRAFDVPPREYYQLLRGEITATQLYSHYPEEATEAAQRTLIAELGSDQQTARIVRERIDSYVADSSCWVLIGGPPCQAYSLVGRARNKGNPSYDPNNDVRQRLYVEYLQILADHAPAVFVMENVKGLLSANFRDQALFQLIVGDLQDPVRALRRDGRSVRRRPSVQYKIFSLTSGALLGSDNIEDAVVRAEDHGVPQARHRVILVGVRDDLPVDKPSPLQRMGPVPAAAVLNGLPPLRSGLSRRPDSDDDWVALIRSQRGRRWSTKGASAVGGRELARRIDCTLGSVTAPQAGRGGEFIPENATVEIRADWFLDERIGGIINHSSRGHMERDLCRYLYAACFAEEYGRSPVLRDFPTDLLPAHESAGAALENGGNFTDRFRVQLRTRPATTVVSHISKDGHYYIHPDPRQCRSLTVREAARLQTFPDNYLFCGPRTAQYTQVGNAVPPLLAVQIAERIHKILQGVK